MPSQALIDAMMAGQPAAPANRPEQSRLLLSMSPGNAPALSPEEETLRNMSPVDALKFSRDLQNRRQYSPDEAAANRAQTAEDLAYVTPVLGNALSARDAYRYGREAATTPDETDAHKNMAMAGLSTLGAMTGLPFGRTAAQASKEAPNLVNIFAGPTAKTADHAALENAQRLAESGASRDEIWSQTGWFKGADGKWRFEIDDSGMTIGSGNQTGVSGEVLSHPELMAAYPNLANLPVSIQRDVPGDWLSFYNSGSSARGPELRVRGHPSTHKSGVTHELQHAVDDLEGTLGSGASYTSPAEAYRALEEIMARNAQGRLGMRANERGTVPPWLVDNRLVKEN